MIQKICLNCKKEFQVYPYRDKAKFCCYKCRAIWQSNNGINLPPKRTNIVPWNKGLTKDTDKRIMKVSNNRKGDKNPNWNGGTTTRFRDKFKKQLVEWRKKVFERDDYTCQDCGERGCELHPHHIKHLSKYPKLAFNVNNGITLCVKCHRKKHSVGK